MCLLRPSTPARSACLPRPHAELYAADQPAFFKDYAVAHVKLSELGVEWEAGAPVTI